MKLNKVETVNFCGMKGRRVFNMPHIIALVGANGVGKTTILNAIRYGLTGDKTAPDIINKDAEEASVEIFFDNKEGLETSFSRTENRKKPSKFRIDGVATTQKALNAYIEEQFGIEIDKIKIASSSDVVAAMKPQEFASFILGYIPEKMTAEDVLALIPDASLEMMEVGEALLPADEVGLEDLDEVDAIIRAQRKDLKASLQVKEANLEGKIKEAPSMTREEVEKEINKISAIENEYKIYEVELRAYKNAEESLASHIKLIEDLKKQLAGITVSRPDPAKVEALREELKTLKETLRNHDKTVIGVNSALEQLEATLEALEKPICPISPLITCHENKTVAIEDVTESIKAAKEGLVALEEERNKAEIRVAEVEAQIKKEEEIKYLYDKKVSLMSQLKKLEDTKPELPKKPEEPEKIEVSERKFQLNEMLKNIISYEEGINLTLQIEKDKATLETLENLVKAFSEKGPVRQGILLKYLGVFEELCNERSRAIRPEISFSFVSENGVVVYMDNGKGVMLPYENLSGGEKAYFLFIIMDMLNQLSGVNILLLDELSVIDNEIFNSFISTVLEHKDDYDHIIMSAVNHTDTVEILKEKAVPMVDLGLGER